MLLPCRVVRANVSFDISVVLTSGPMYFSRFESPVALAASVSISVPVSTCLYGSQCVEHGISLLRFATGRALALRRITG